MAITYSSNLKFTLIGTGDQAGTWGNTTNTNIGTLIEQSIAGYVSQTVADSAGSPTSLTIADGTSSAARNMLMVLQGALTAARELILPTSTKLYFIHNNTSGGHAVTVKCLGQTGISVPNGAKAILACNGTDIIEAANYFSGIIFPASATIATLSGTTLGYGSASITTASIGSGTVANLLATTFTGTSATITNLNVTSLTTANFPLPTSGTIATLSGTTLGYGSASITTASIASGTITQFTSTSATITNLNVTSLNIANYPLPASGTIGNLAGTNLVYSSATLGNVFASGNVGIGTSSPSTKLEVSTSFGTETLKVTQTDTTGATQATVRLSHGSGTQATYSVGEGYAVTGTTTSAPFVFTTNNTERMRLDASGNLGIGTSSPTSGYKLDVAGNIYASSGLFSSKNGANQVYVGAAGQMDFGSGGSDLIIGTTASPIRFGSVPTNTEWMRLDSAGNLGLGVTPSAWSSNQRSLQIRDSGGFTGAFYAGFGAVGVGSNNFYGGGASSTYIATGFASKYEQISGQHQWFNAPSGTAGNPITFTQAMTLDANGNLGVGTSSPSDKLQVTGGTLRVENTLGYGATMLNTSGMGMYMTLADQGNSSAVGTNNGSLIFYNSGNTTERMRIDASGNVGIGTTSPAYKLQVNNNATVGIGASSLSGISPILYLDNGNTANGSVTIKSHNVGSGNVIGAYRMAVSPDGTNYSWAGMAALEDANANAATLAFYTSAGNASGASSTERMRIDSAGNVGIGTSSPVSRLEVNSGSGTAPVLSVYATNPTFGAGDALGTISFGSTDSGNNIPAASISGLNETASSSANGIIRFSTRTASSVTEKMRLDSAGNVGIGVTPSAWFGTISAMQVGSGGSLWSSKSTPNNTVIGSNYYVDSASATDRYLANDRATHYQQNDGQHIWRTAPSGTAGNAITFTQAMTLDASGNLGVGTTSPASTAGVTLSKTSNVAYEALLPTVASIAFGYNNSGSANAWGASTGTAFFGTPQAVPITFTTGAVERMRLDSAGNVGIGTSSPSNRLQVEATSNTAYSPSNTLAGGVLAYVKNASTTNSTDATIRLEATGSNSLAASSISSVHTGDGQSALTFGTRTSGASDVTEKMRIDSAGNLGLGVTPSAWATPAGIDIGGFAGFGQRNDNGWAVSAHNSYFSSTGWKYKATGIAAAYYGVGSGTHQWFTAPSGTAGDAISFTQAMTLDASGNVQIGSTTNSFSARIYSLETSATEKNNVALYTTGAHNTCRVALYNDSGAASVQSIVGALSFSSGGVGSGSERMRIASDGNVGIGVASPTQKLDVAGSILASGNVTAYSDIRVKDNVESITDAIEKLSQIRGVTYTRTDLEDKERKYAGVIAQEIEQVLPEAVFDNGKVKAVDYNATIALLIEAVKQQQGQINELKLTIEQLKGN